MLKGSFKITHEEYHKDPCDFPSLSRGTILDLLFRSPLHAWANHPKLNPLFQKEENGKFDIGQAAHAWFLEGVNKIFIIEADDWRTKEAKNKRDEARINNQIPLLEKQADQVRNMVDIAKNRLNHSELSGLFDKRDAELTYIWNEGPTWCRAMVDMISKDRKFILDYKTTGVSANPEDFIRVILSHGYDVQESFYRRGVKNIEGTDPKFIFMVQENEPPYQCSFVGLSPEFQNLGESKVVRGLDLWRTCILTGEWPGYPKQVCWVDPPPWALGWEMKANFIGNKLEDI